MHNVLDFEGGKMPFIICNPLYTNSAVIDEGQGDVLAQIRPHPGILLLQFSHSDLSRYCQEFGLYTLVRSI
jgi:hypothetical protein